jgi:hypothetical protein
MLHQARISMVLSNQGTPIFIFIFIFDIISGSLLEWNFIKISYLLIEQSRDILKKEMQSYTIRRMNLGI